MIECALTLAGVVLPSLAIILAVRRWFERVPWRMAFLLLVLALLFVARGVFTSDMPVPLDEVARGYPYRGLVGDVQAKNGLSNDVVKQILPWMQTVREEFAHGRAPLWNPYLFCGYPLLGNGQSAPFAPLFLATLFVPLPKQLVAMAGAKLFVALLFGFLFIKREGTSDAAAVFGSSVFAFAIFNNCFLYYPMTAVTLLLPAAAYATTLTLRERRVAPMVLLAIVVASLLAGGHPESVVHVAMCCVALLLIERGAKRRDWARVTFAAICGLLIAAPAWLPVLEQVMMSLRVKLLGHGEAMGWNEYARFFKAAEVPDASIDVKRIADPEQPLVDFLNVRFLLTEPGVKLGGKWRPIYSGMDGELYENSAVGPRFFGPAGVSVFTRQERPGRYTLTIRSPARALIGSSQPAIRGWRARVNGHPVGITRFHDVFMGFFVDSGESKVIVDYRPSSWTWSLGLAVFGAVALAVGSRRKWWNRLPEGRVVERPYTGFAL